MTQINPIEVSLQLTELVAARLEKAAQDPQVAGVVGEPVPAQTVQGGAEQMMPPPGAAVGAPAPAADPATQLVEVVSQLGMLVEQGLSMIAELLTRTADSQERVERQLILLTGQELEQRKVEPQMAAPQPKVAAATPPEGFYDVSTVRDGVSSRPQDAMSTADQLRKSASLAAAIALIHARRDAI